MVLSLPKKSISETRIVRTVHESKVTVYSDGTTDATLTNTFTYVLGKKLKKFKQPKKKKMINIEEEGEM